MGYSRLAREAGFEGRGVRSVLDRYSRPPRSVFDASPIEERKEDGRTERQRPGGCGGYDWKGTARRSSAADRDKLSASVVNEVLRGGRLDAAVFSAGGVTATSGRLLRSRNYVFDERRAQGVGAARESVGTFDCRCVR
ncbi:hypothetical protein KM043_002805 [Ampulex compressa]|nr:hypothetical protein KM043_002805 [Ampulex compressa]